MMNTHAVAWSVVVVGVFMFALHCVALLWRVIVKAVGEIWRNE